MATPTGDTQSLPPQFSGEPETVSMAITLDPMDLPASILYLTFNVILSVTPVVFYYTFIQPILSQWSGGYNVMYKTAWMIMWIANLVFYGIPAILGPFGWTYNIYVVGIYVIWSQYFVVWGGTILQFLNFILMLTGAATYSNVSSVGGADSNSTAWIEFGVWAGITAGCLVGYWLLNDNFLAYYVLAELIN